MESRTAAYFGESSAHTADIKGGCPGSGPSSGSAGSDGEYIAAVSSGLNRARGVRIVPLRTTDIGTTVERNRDGCFSCGKVGSCCDSLPELE